MEAEQPAGAAPRGAPVTVRVVAGRELGRGLLARWSALQQADPALSSPFYSPDFTSIVARARDDVFVGVLERDEQPVGFFPFQRGRSGLGRPVGSIMSDYHGAIVQRGVRWDATALLEACGLKLWEFDHLIAEQKPFAAFHRRVTQSWVMDLSAGAEAYLKDRQRAGVREIAGVARKRRKLERELGEISFEPHVTDPDVFRRLARWKADQYRRTGASDHLAQRWVREVLQLALARQSPTFAGMLSALYVEGRLVAAHFGIRSCSDWHYWYPAYDPQFAHYSPGLILLLQMAERAPSLGIEAIDLGKGDARYKRAMANRAVPVAEGAVVRASLAADAWRLRREIRVLAKRSAMGPRLRRLATRARGSLAGSREPRVPSDR